jgi:hypothetical protein
VDAAGGKFLKWSQKEWITWLVCVITWNGT